MVRTAALADPGRGLDGSFGVLQRLEPADPARFAALPMTQPNSGSEGYVFRRLRRQIAGPTDEIGRAEHNSVTSVRLGAIESIVSAFE